MNRRTAFVPAIAVLLAALPALAGTLTITGGWSRSTPPGVTVGVAYFTLRNDTGKSDRLLKISSPVADSVQVHRTEILDGIARMREVMTLHVDAGQTLEFAPNGMHVMLMGLKKPLAGGQKFELDFLFEAAGPKKVTIEVKRD